jgi:hypothetical protein
MCSEWIRWILLTSVGVRDPVPEMYNHFPPGHAWIPLPWVSEFLTYQRRVGPDHSRCGVDSMCSQPHRVAQVGFIRSPESVSHLDPIVFAPDFELRFVYAL